MTANVEARPVPPARGPCRPIIFRGASVRAIIEGRKTQTRRIVSDSYAARRCPYGAVGDRLWVREAWARSRSKWMYRAEYPSGEGPRDNTDEWDWDPACPNRWKPSIHMPRRASRLTLEVVSVRVERVDDISEADALAEGFEPDEVTDSDIRQIVSDRSVDENVRKLAKVFGPGRFTAKHLFLSTFYDLNRRTERYSNPWVWVIGFSRVEGA